MIGIAWLQQILNKIGKKDDTAAMNTTLFAGQQEIHDDVADLITRTKGLDDIHDDIATISGLTAKEKAFMGKAGQPTLNEYFLNVAHGAAPDANIWTVTVDAGASVTIIYTTTPGFCSIGSGATPTNDATIRTAYKKMWSIGKPGVTTLHWKSKFRINDLTGEAGIGFGEQNILTADGCDNAARYPCTIHCDNDVVRACSGNNYGLDETDISAYFADNTYVEVEVRLTTSSVKFYVDGTLRATHETNIPDFPLLFIAAAKNTNGINTTLYIQNIEVWAE